MPEIAQVQIADDPFDAGDFGEALHRVVMGCEQPGQLLIELAEVIFDHA